MPRLTLKRIRDVECPPEKNQVFLWDDDAKGLGLRVTKSAKVFIFQGRLPDRDGKLYTFRMKLGDSLALLLEDARERARDAAMLVSKGVDPRQERLRVAEQEAVERQERDRQDLTIAEIWPIYCGERAASWSARYKELHERFIHRGLEPRTRSKKKTVPGPLASIADLPLSAITADTIKAWLAKEKAVRPTQTRIAFEMLSTFLNWCNDHRLYKGIASPDACSARIKKDNLARKSSRDDCLQREQLRAWFDSVRRYESRIMSAYVQTVLLTGGRREEVMALKWDDVDFRWKTLSITTTKGGTPRDIPLTPYISSLLYSLPRMNQWVFSSPSSANGRIQSPTRAFQRMMRRAEIEGLTLHGLRRSFSTLAEWLEAPAGAIAQIQGHAPTAISEKHYKKRPIDLLRVWHEKIEAWILAESGIEAPITGREERPLKLVGAGK